MIIIYFVYISSFLLLVESRIGWHLSQVALTKLYDLQNDHFNVINEYLELESKRLEELKNDLTSMNERRDRKITNKSTYVQNHINAMKMMARIHHQQRKIEHLTDNKQSMEALNKIDEQKEISEDHIFLSSQGLRRLQRFYGFPVSDIAEGRYNDRIIGDQMNACECYVIAKYCFEQNDMYGAITWAIQTYNKWTNGDQPKCIDIEQLISQIASSSVYTGFYFTTLFYSKKLHYTEDTAKFAQYFFLMKEEFSNSDENRALNAFNVDDSLESYQFMNTFKKLCKCGKSMRTITKDSKCRYQTKNSYYRILMPFKEEDLYNDPCIKIYHDVLYDDEIIKIKTMASKNMDDLKIVGNSGNELVEDARSGQLKWINEHQENGQFNLLNSRIETLTGYFLNNSESYQVVNYGLSGHFQLHRDAMSQSYVLKKIGNRLMTVLFYLSDVHNDGYTSFPKLNIVCPVEKGSALVWNNLHLTNGTIHDESLHGSCPILKGNKWKFNFGTRPLTVDSKCRYQTKYSPYGLLMSFKEEDISPSSFIKLYHDVLYDGKVETNIDIAEKNGKFSRYTI